MSGAVTDRPALHDALEFARSGDTLIVWKLDRLARSMKQLIETIETLRVRGIGFRSLTEALDTTIADVIVGVLGKMHSYLIETPREEIAAARVSLTGTSLQNAKLLRDLIGVSDATNIAFFHHITSAHDLEKLDLFLRFSHGSYAI
jgi:hypothetical protein